MSWRGKAAILLGSAVLLGFILVGVLEIGLRVRQALTQTAAGAHGVEEFYVYDPALDLRVPKAGYRSRQLNINQLGFRGAEFTVAKPDGTIRIAFLGGSTTFCSEVSSDDMAWPQRVIQALREAYPTRRFEQVNAGVPGYTLRSIMRNLDLRVARLRPDVIVIYEATNDLSMHMASAAQQTGLDAARGDGELTWLDSHSLLAYLVRKNILFLRRQWQADADAGKLTVASETLGAEFAHDLTKLVQAARQLTDKVVLVTFAARLRAGQSPDALKQAATTALYYMPYRKPSDIVRDFAVYNETIRRVARVQNVALVEAAERIPGDAAHYTDSVHFTDLGAAVMSQALAEGLVATGWFGPAAR